MSTHKVCFGAEVKKKKKRNILNYHLNYNLAMDSTPQPLYNTVVGGP